jgi:hypothetical protein
MLFKSVFARYMLAFVVIILLSFSILAMIVSGQFMSYSKELKNDELSRIANQSSAILKTSYSNSEYSDLREFVSSEYMMLYKMFEFVDSGEEINVILADTNGKILWCTQLDSQKETYVDQNKTLSKETLKKALNSDFGTEETTLNGVLKNPCYVNSLALDIDGETQGVLFVTTASSNVYNFVISTVKTIVMSCMWVMCGAIIASYFISEKIVHPIRQMSQAAREFG